MQLNVVVAILRNKACHVRMCAPALDAISQAMNVTLLSSSGGLVPGMMTFWWVLHCTSSQQVCPKRE